MMIDANLAHFIIGIVGNITSLLLFAAPIPTFLQIWNNGLVGAFEIYPYLTAILNCGSWVLYGTPFIHPDNIVVLTTNSIGLVIELIYVIIYLRFTGNGTRLCIFVCLVVEAVAIAAIAIIAAFIFHSYHYRSVFVGIVANTFGVLMYASPFTAVYNAIRTGSVEHMPFLPSLTFFLNGSVWLAYALIRFDLFILIGNGLGALFGLLQLVVYAWYYYHPIGPPADNSETESSQEEEGPEVPAI